MKMIKILGFTALTAVTMGIAAEAHAGKKGMDPVTRYDVMTNEKLRQHLSPDEIVNLHQYFDYKDREPCQEYQNPPAGFYYKDCQLWFDGYRDNVVSMHDVHFDFGSAQLTRYEKGRIARIATRINKENPSEVLVAGHTDTVGSAAQNKALAYKRAKAVAKELRMHGISARAIDKKAYGESKLAVQTGDNVKSRENRRVEIMYVR